MKRTRDDLFFTGTSDFGEYLSNHDDRVISGEFGALHLDAGSLESGSVTGKGEFVRPAFTKKFIKTIFIIIILGNGALFARAASLQIKSGGSYRALAENNRLRIRTIPAERGVILDRNGYVLVSNIPTFSLSVTPGDLPIDWAERDRVLNEVVKIAGVTRTDLDRFLFDFEGSREPVPIRENLDYESALKAEINISALPGVTVNQDIRRNYIGADASRSLSQVLGYQGIISKKEYESARIRGYKRTDRIGKTGVESSYETALRGIYGNEKIEVDALGRKKSIISKEEAVPGKNLVLTIDVHAQQKLEEALLRSMRNAGSSRGVAIALDPRGGEIIAIVSLPSFSSNDFAAGLTNETYKQLLEDPNKPLFFRAIAGEFPSGSTIKPIISLAALDEGIINANTTVRSVGGIQIGEWFFPDWKAGGHGDVNVIRAIAESVNTFFYYIGGGFGGFKGLGPDKIAEHAKRFGLGKKLSIDLPGEAEGLIPSEEWKEKTKKEQWYIGDTYHMAIGQGDVLVTPLQIAASTGAIANGGTLWKPHVARGMVTSGKNGEAIKLEVLQDEAAKLENINIVRRGMREAVTAGSARGLSGIGVSAAGKTGTAQWRDERAPHAWFTGFAPYENPEIVITVLVEEGGEGSVAAVPVAREFLDWYFKSK